MTTLRLLNLVCITSRRGSVEFDSPVIKVWSTRLQQWELASMRTGQDWKLQVAIQIAKQAKIEIWDIDWGAWCPHENDANLGTHVIDIAQLSQGTHDARFQAAGANYLLTYAVVA